MNVLTATGTVTLQRRYFWSRAIGGLCPVDVRVGIHDRTVTAGACCILCTLGVIHDFKQAAERVHHMFYRVDDRCAIASRLFGSHGPRPLVW